MVLQHASCAANEFRMSRDRVVLEDVRYWSRIEESDVRHRRQFRNDEFLGSEFHQRLENNVPRYHSWNFRRGASRQAKCAV